MEFGSLDIIIFTMTDKMQLSKQNRSSGLDGSMVLVISMQAFIFSAGTYIAS